MPPKRDASWYCIPFPVLFYKQDKGKDIHTTMDLVDSINGPAMVIPTSINCKAYIETNKNTRADISFFAIPYEFLVRDNWEDLVLQRDRAAADSVEDTLLGYERASKDERTNMLEIIRNYAFPDHAQGREEENEDENDDDRDEEENDDDDDDDDEQITADRLLNAYTTKSGRRSRR